MHQNNFNRMILPALVCAAMAMAGVETALGAGKVKVPKFWTLDATGSVARAFDGVFGERAASTWQFSGGDPKRHESSFAVETDAGNGRDVFVSRAARGITLINTTVSNWAGKEIVFRVRMGVGENDKPGAVTLAIAKDPEVGADKGLAVTLGGNKVDSISINAIGAKVSYSLRACNAIMPTWPDMLRIPIEYDMAKLPLVADSWITVTYRCGSDSCEVWVDDRFVARKTGPDLKLTGALVINAMDGARVAAVVLKPWQGSDERFLPLGLDGYARDRVLSNGQAVADDALPFGAIKYFAGVPFRFVDRTFANGDHIDVGRSVMRQGNLDGYFDAMSPRLGHAFLTDPARIQMRVPFDYYDAMYAIAGFDDEPGNIPSFTASFFRQAAGFHQIFEQTVPSLAAREGGDALPVPVTLANGRKIKLWLVKMPVDPARMTGFSDLKAVEIELSKKMHLYRSYPDPIVYSWSPAGMPSGVHIYALTLRRTPLTLKLEPAVFGHVWTAPETPAYNLVVNNRGTQARAVTVTAMTRSHDGTETTRQVKTLKLGPGMESLASFEFTVKLNGIHNLDVTVNDGSFSWTESRNFARLAKDTRSPYWKPGDGALFGYWSYHGGHNTPPAAEIMRLMKLAGARGVTHQPKNGDAARQYDEWKWRCGGDAHVVNNPGDWAATWPIDPSNATAYLDKCETTIRKQQGDNPEFIEFFTEPSTTRDITSGNPPDYWGEPPWKFSDDEQKRVAMFRNAATIAAEMVRVKFPQSKILIPWGDPLFIVALLRAGLPAKLVDGTGLDMIGFERLPEQQIHQMSTHRLYILKEEFKKAGIPNPLLVYVEGIFEPTEPGALTWQEQAERYHRWTLISMAYGVERFHSGWFAFDCGNWYGSEHYGGCGIQRRVPFCDPKPAYAHFATMTRQLNGAKFDSWLPTGSHTVFCLKFTRRDGTPVYAMWTVRGKRPVNLALEKKGAVTVVDSMDNATPITPGAGQAGFVLGTEPVYIYGNIITGVSLGIPDHSDAVSESRSREQATFRVGPAKLDPPVAAELKIGDFGDGTWEGVDKRDEIYENNNYDTKRFKGKMSFAVTNDPGRQGASLSVHLEQQDRERKLMPWYTIVKPAKPVMIPGRSVALGIMVRAQSDWGRVVYSLLDAKGERWLNCGTRDQWNCNDPHGWSMFNFDGWRYLRFELPGNAPYDCFREAGTTWWGHYGGDGIVDLPLKIESIIVERRTHVVYVNDVQPADPADILLGELTAEYTAKDDMGDAAVAGSRVRMPMPTGKFEMKNPIKEMAASDLPPVTLEKYTLPDWDNDGTKCFVHFTGRPEAGQYQVWVAAYPDGRGAVALATMKKSGGQVRGLRPATKLYLWVTYTEEAGGTKKGSIARSATFSKPSNRLEIQLIDAFGMK